MGVVAGMHVAAIFVIAHSFGIIPPMLRPENIEVISVDQPPPPDVSPAHVDPAFEDPTIRVPIPDDPSYESPAQPDSIAAQPIDPGLSNPVGPGSATIPEIVNAHLDAHHPLSQPPYPAPDIRLGNEGNAEVEVYVLPSGRIGEARIARSTGFDRLDRSALEEAKRNWKMIPATRDGVAIAQWYKVRVTFKLTNR
jgi:protein TonB